MNVNTPRTASAAVRSPRDIDRGFAWVTLLLAIVCRVWAFGPLFAIGTFGDYLQEEYNATLAQVDAMVSAYQACLFGTSFASTVMFNKFGVSTTVMAGGVVMITGFGLAHLSTEMWMIQLTLGVLTGFGSGLCFTTIICVVPFFFKKYQTFATVISVLGNGIGGIVCPKLYQLLLNDYRVRGACLKLSLLSIIVLLCGILFSNATQIMLVIYTCMAGVSIGDGYDFVATILVDQPRLLLCC